MRTLKGVRFQLPAPPAAEPVDRLNIQASIISIEWCKNNCIPIPADIIDSEYTLTSEVYRRILYTEDWGEKDTQISQYLKIVDDKRDFTLQQMSTVTFQCLDRHAKLRRSEACLEAQVKSHRLIQIKLFDQTTSLQTQNRELQLLLKKELEKQLPTRTNVSCSQNARASKNTKSVHFVSCSGNFTTTQDASAEPPPPTPTEAPATALRRSSRETKTPTIFVTPTKNVRSALKKAKTPVHSVSEDSDEGPSETELELSNLALQDISDDEIDVEEFYHTDPEDYLPQPLSARHLENLLDQNVDNDIATEAAQRHLQEQLVGATLCPKCLPGSNKLLGHSESHRRSATPAKK
jgi:hypothetical protein